MRSITPRRAAEHYHKFKCPRAFCPLPPSHPLFPLPSPHTILLMLSPCLPRARASISPWPPPFLRLTLWQRLNLATAVGARSPVTNIPGCAAWGAAVMHRPRCSMYASFSLGEIGDPLRDTFVSNARVRVFTNGSLQAELVPLLTLLHKII